MVILEEVQSFGSAYHLSPEAMIALCGLCARLVTRALMEVSQTHDPQTFATRFDESQVTAAAEVIFQGIPKTWVSLVDATAQPDPLPYLQLPDVLATDDALVLDNQDAARLNLGERYEDLGILGIGGMGIVHRIFERSIGRRLAMKVLKPDLCAKPRSVARFVEEAQVIGQLQHPGLVPVHELGYLPDGRPYFTMREVRGRELGEVISEVHAASVEQWQVSPSGWTFPKLLNAFLWICETVAYAHSRGVIHRDLKPSNVLIGSSDEVLVVDWGIAKVLGRPTRDEALSREEAVTTDRSQDPAFATQAGAITGTPAYMPPEQAFGQVADIGTRSDVYALGAIFYQLLSGHPPYQGSGALLAVALGPPPPVVSVSARSLPPDLIEICERAMRRDPAERYATAKDLAEALTSWLDSTKRRDKALALVQAAADLEHSASLTQRHADTLRSAGQALLAPIPPYAPEEDKHPGWDKEAEATQLTQQSELQAIKAEQQLYAALTEVPDLTEAHAALARRYLAQHREAETFQQRAAAARAEVLLRAHTDALPTHSPERQRITAYLQGVGALTLWTDPPGAEVQLFRYVEKHRRLHPVFERVLGRTPLDKVALDPGSYLCVLQRTGFEPVRYPVFIERQQHWDGIRPGDHDPFPIHLPKVGSLSPEEVYIPAGWFWAGGDAEATGALPRRRLWVDPFSIWRFPITNAEYIAFLDDLVAHGREEEALHYVPRERSGTASEQGAAIYGCDNDGRFFLRPDTDGDLWLPGYPVVMIDWWSAAAYCAHLGVQKDQPWRLPSECAWEKAARGVDGRFFPWGHGFDPSWCCMTDSHQGSHTLAVEGSFPVDTSPYGVRSLAGNVCDWCADPWSKRGPSGALADFLALPHDHASDGDRVVRGGAWNNSMQYCRAARRDYDLPTGRAYRMGFRPSRSLR